MLSDSFDHQESNGAGENPDLHYNRANVCRYKEEYAQAISGYTKASTLDPSLPAEEAIEGILRWVTRVNDLIHRKVVFEYQKNKKFLFQQGRLKAKKLEALVSSFPPPSSSFIAGRQVTSVSQLRYPPLPLLADRLQFTHLIIIKQCGCQSW